MYGIRKAPPPFSYAVNGNRQTLPRPTDMAMQDSRNSLSFPHCCRAGFVTEKNIYTQFGWVIKRSLVVGILRLAIAIRLRQCRKLSVVEINEQRINGVNRFSLQVCHIYVNDNYHFSFVGGSTAFDVIPVYGRLVYDEGTIYDPARNHIRRLKQSSDNGHSNYVVTSTAF